MIGMQTFVSFTLRKKESCILHLQSISHDDYSVPMATWVTSKEILVSDWYEYIYIYISTNMHMFQTIFWYDVEDINIFHMIYKILKVLYSPVQDLHATKFGALMIIHTIYVYFLL